MKIAILRNEDPQSGDKWLKACEARGLTADIIDLCSMDAMEQIVEGGYDLCLLRPPGLFETYKAIYDEKLFHIANTLKIPCFPSFFENYIYENKKSLAAFLIAAKIPHPRTWVIGHKAEAIRFIEQSDYPIVAKTSIGAASSGVTILRNAETASKYIYKAFSGRGIIKRVGPNRQVGNTQSWIRKAISDPDYLKKKLNQYYRSWADTQKGFVIFQEYIEHDFEWRIVRIGESYFAYKKYKVGDKASGAKNLGYVNPPLDLLSWIKEISEKHNINTAAFDVFVNAEEYLINEIQTIFGHVWDHILEVDGKPGRYLYQEREWVFEPGMFNTNESYDLRLETALKLYAEGKL